MTGEQIIIQPQDLQQIIEELAAKKWDSGPVIIRDLGKQFIVRDKNNGYITEIDNNIYKDG